MDGRKLMNAQYQQAIQCLSGIILVLISLDDTSNLAAYQV
jgi:hypothetical protein